MSVCIRCFFENTYQLQLKRKAFGSPKFEDTLVNYKNLFMKEIDSLAYVKECECCNSSEYSLEYQEFLDDVLEEIKRKRDYIEQILEDIIEVYMEYIIHGREYALYNMKKFLKNHCTNYKMGSTVKFCEPMFRVRTRDNYDNGDIHELYHVPFDKRYLTRNRRFSLSGQTMLYTAESLETALEEVGTDLKNAYVAVFMPKETSFYSDEIYNIKNRIIEYLKNAYIEEKNSKQFIADSILFQILQFPVQKEFSGTFVQEYVLPQLMMEILNQRAYRGVIYQTTKEINWEGTSIDGNYPDTNYCFFIPYKRDTRYNEEFLNKFFFATWNEEVPFVTYAKLKKTIHECKNPYVDKIEQHVEKMLQCMGKETYTTKKIGRIEMTLLYHLILQIEN